MTMNMRLPFAALCAASLAACGGAGEGTRDSIRVVGSSTVYPFAKLVAENFSRSNTQFAAPITASVSACACERLLPGGTLRVGQTWRPLVERWPLVPRPSTVAPA